MAGRPAAPGVAAGAPLGRRVLVVRTAAVMRRSDPVSLKVFGDETASASNEGDMWRPHNFPFGDFPQCRDRDFVRALDTGRAPSGELPGTKTRHDCELECVEVNGPMYHTNRPFWDAGSRGSGFSKPSTSRMASSRLELKQSRRRLDWHDRPHSKALVRAGPESPRAQKSRKDNYTSTWLWWRTRTAAALCGASQAEPREMFLDDRVAFA